MSNIKNLKKISVKELLGLTRTDDAKAIMADIVKKFGSKPLFRIKGNVTGYAEKKTQYGESFMLIGQFIAQNFETNEIFKSGRAYLPKSASEEIVGQFKSRSEAQNGVEFTADVFVVTDTASATGYSYDVRPIATVETLAWEAKAMQEMLALPAPEKTALKIAGKK